MLALRVSLTRFSTSIRKCDRFSRESLRQRIREQEFRDLHKNQLNKIPNPEKYSDAIPVRPVSDLYKALGFTVATGVTTFAIAVWNDVDRAHKEYTNLFKSYDFTRFSSRDERQSKYSELRIYGHKLTAGEQATLALIGMNAVVCLLWRVPRLQPLFWRYFTNSFASKSLCAPMLLSVFSHNNFIHFALNMYVCYSFTSLLIDNFLGENQFWAVYLTAGVLSSFTSLCHKAIVRSPIRALGASGAILGVLAYVCMKMPEARLRILFLPFFDFSAESAVIGIILFDICGLLFRFKLFDHAAHLGGTLFGVFYALYGQEMIYSNMVPVVDKIYQSIKGGSL